MPNRRSAHRHENAIALWRRLRKRIPASADDEDASRTEDYLKAPIVLRGFEIQSAEVQKTWHGQQTWKLCSDGSSAPHNIAMSRDFQLMRWVSFTSSLSATTSPWRVIALNEVLMVATVTKSITSSSSA